MLDSLTRRLALGLTIAASVALTAGPAVADKCTAAKLKAIAKKESGLLKCQAKVALKGDPTLHAAINTIAMAACYSPNPRTPVGFDLPFDPRTGERLRNWPGGGPLRGFLSTVDNGWMAVALMMAGRSHPEHLRCLGIEPDPFAKRDAQLP